MTDNKSTRRRTAKPVETPEVVAEEPTVAPAKPVEAPKPKPVKVQSAMVFKKRLSQGDHGPAVDEVQRLLCARGFWDGAQDGRFGSMLAKAVRQFQGVSNIRPTGEVDAKTWEAMNL